MDRGQILSFRALICELGLLFLWFRLPRRFDLFRVFLYVESGAKSEVLLGGVASDPAKVVCLFYPAALACWIVVKFGFSAGTQGRQGQSRIGALGSSRFLEELVGVLR